MIIPVYTALERIPDSLIEASSDLGARAIPHDAHGGAAARAARHRRRFDLHVLADARRLHHAAAHRRDELEPHRQRDLRQHRHREQPAVRGRARDRADRDHDDLPARARGASARSRRCDGEPAMDACRARLRVGDRRLAVPVHPDRDDRRSSRSTARTIQSWPIQHYTTHWFSVAWHDQAGARRALAVGQGRASRRRSSRCCSARPPRSRCTGSGSSAARQSRCCWCCRSRCPASSPGIALQSFFSFNQRQPVAHDDHHRPHDVLHRRDLQQRARAAAAYVVVARSRRRPTSARTRCRRSASSRCRCSRPR